MRESRALMPESGGEHGHPGERRGAEAEVGKRDGGSDDDPDRSQCPGTGRRIALGDLLDHACCDRAPIGTGGGLRREGLGIRRRRQHEHSLARGGGTLEHPVERAEPLVGDRRHGVGFQRRPGCQPRLAVGVHRRPQIAALDVGDDQKARGSCRPEHLFESGVARRAVPLVEGDLWLDDSGPARGRLDDSQTEVPGSTGRIRECPGVEQCGVRVDADAEPAGRLEDQLQPRSEGLRHPVTPAASAMPAARVGSSRAARSAA